MKAILALRPDLGVTGAALRVDDVLPAIPTESVSATSLLSPNVDQEVGLGELPPLGQ